MPSPFINPELRRRAALVLVGTASMLVALLVRQRLLVERHATPTRAAMLALLAGVLTALVLWRTFTYFATRRR